jgi:hypothetical protein
MENDEIIISWIENGRRYISWNKKGKYYKELNNLIRKIAKEIKLKNVTRHRRFHKYLQKN